MILKLAGEDIFVLKQNNPYKLLILLNFMDLNEKVDFDLLKELSSFQSAICLARKFEKHYGKAPPTEQKFYEVYLKYLECKIFYGKVFSKGGKMRTLAIHYLSPNFPELRANQFRFLEDYLARRKIIAEKVFAQA